MIQCWTQRFMPRQRMSAVLDTLRTSAYMPDMTGHVWTSLYNVHTPDMHALQVPAVCRQPQDALLHPGLSAGRVDIAEHGACDVSYDAEAPRHVSAGWAGSCWVSQDWSTSLLELTGC